MSRAILMPYDGSSVYGFQEIWLKELQILMAKFKILLLNFMF